jgi:hypothetical protein
MLEHDVGFVLIIDAQRKPIGAFPMGIRLMVPRASTHR